MRDPAHPVGVSMSIHAENKLVKWFPQPIQPLGRLPRGV